MKKYVQDKKLKQRSGKPSIFILGAPKSGTTSFAAYLDQHPMVTMSQPKEPNYFSTDLPQLSEAKNISEYLSFFDFSKKSVVFGGEASTWYLYSKKAVTNILEFEPQAKLIAMLRNPTDLFFSLHAQFKYNLTETHENPRAAWEMQVERPRNSLLKYREACALGSQVTRLLESAPRSQVHFIIFDDLKKDPKSEYEKALDFLDLPKYDNIDFTILNQRKTHRSKILEKSIRYSSPFLDNSIEAAKRLIGIKRLGITRAFIKWNEKPAPRPPSDPAFRAALVREFLPEVELLESALNVQLSDWK